MKTLGEDFIRGYISIAEGEKDPRNLLLAFAIDRVLLIEFDVQKFIEVGIRSLSAFDSTMSEHGICRICSMSPSAISPSRSGLLPTTLTESLPKNLRVPYGMYNRTVIVRGFKLNGLPPS